jgi:2-isopropylmalate synthase
MHIDGVNKISKSFEHVDPQSVGNERRFLMSEVSGRTTLLKLIQKIDPSLKKHSPQTKVIIQTLKELEHDGYQFEAASASFELVVRKELGLYNRFQTGVAIRYSENLRKITSECATAEIKVKVTAKTKLRRNRKTARSTRLTGTPKSTVVFYPFQRDVHLTDYKVWD